MAILYNKVGGRYMMEEGRGKKEEGRWNESGGLVPVLIEPPLCGSFCVMRFATKSREEIWFSAR